MAADILCKEFGGLNQREERVASIKEAFWMVSSKLRLRRLHSKHPQRLGSKLHNKGEHPPEYLDFLKSKHKSGRSGSGSNGSHGLTI